MISTVSAGARASGFSISPEWEGETAFLICGGPSVKLANLDLLRGRRVMVINSSCYALPSADILFYGDERWEIENRAAVKAFQGRVISASYGNVHCDYISFLRRPKPSDTPPGLSSDRSEAWLRHTSVRGAINVLCHLGVAEIVPVGLDGGTDHHHEPHPWGINKDILSLQLAELEGIVSPLSERGVTLLNASPGSKIPFWPIMSLAEVLHHG
jgi:hypothetical protein